MRKISSAGANKLLKALQDEKSYLLSIENESDTYILADGEKADPPVYDYEETQSKIEELDIQTRKIKHALNVFNCSTVLNGVGLTIDEALVEMAQLNRTKQKLDVMRRRLPKDRVNGMYSRIANTTEYQYINYDMAKVQADYKSVSERITNIQIALDFSNQTVEFEIED